MWETDWDAPPPDLRLSGPVTSRIDPDTIELAYLLFWMEHCIECAIPDCYSVCPLYVARRDHKCARLRYGIHANREFRGLHDFGADVHFRRWGKLESKLSYGPATPARARELRARDTRALALVNPVAAALEGVNPKRRLNGAYTLLRDRSLAAATRVRGGAARAYDEFVIEVFHAGDAPVSLIVEIHQDRLRYRESFPLAPGPNLHRVPFAAMDVDLSRGEGRILVHPENDAEVRLVFTWLDFVRYTPAARRARVAPARPAANGAAPVTDGAADAMPAAKVKCVAWDLDHTLWRGILVEDGADACVVNPAAVELVHRLDERGILNTIVSKNDHGPAWAHIQALGLDQMFVSPAINWGRKSENLRQVAEELNINIDTFAFIDDSPFERSEVQSELPQVRVFSDVDIASLLGRPEFDVPVTADGSKRRLTYLVEDRRKEIAASFGGNYDDFLRSCEIHAELFPPLDAKSKKRALELIQRSNQLNLSTRRYTEAEFEALLADPNVLSLAWRCHDRYGDYGTVGFLSIALGETPVLQDLVISCRVARKKVENGLFHWIAGELRARGHTLLRGMYRATSRNGVLLDALRDVGFAEAGEQDGARLLELPLDRDVPGGTIVDVTGPATTTPAPEAGAAR